MGKLSGREFMWFDGFYFQRSENAAQVRGTLILREDGVVFRRARSPLAALFSSRGAGTDASDEFELSYKEIDNTVWDDASICLRLQNDTRCCFLSPRRDEVGQAGSYIHDRMMEYRLK